MPGLRRQTTKSSPVFAVQGNTGSKVQQPEQDCKLLNEQTVPSNDIIHFLNKHNILINFTVCFHLWFIPLPKPQIINRYQQNSGHDSIFHSSIFCLYSHVLEVRTVKLVSF